MQITTDEEHAEALAEIERLFDISIEDPLVSYFMEIVDAVEAYEQSRWPIVER